MCGIENSKDFEKKKEEIINKFVPEFLKKEFTEIRSYYPKKDKEEIPKNVDLFLFNNKISKENFVSTRTYFKENENEKYKIITDLVDDNFLSLINITQLFDLKQTYIVESDIYKMGDFTIEFSKIYLESKKLKNKFVFCINNSYGHSFEETFDFVNEVVENLFNESDKNKIIDSCRVNEELLIKYGLINKELKQEEEHMNNIISEKFPQIKLIQYITYVFEL